MLRPEWTASRQKKQKKRAHNLKRAPSVATVFGPSSSPLVVSFQMLKGGVAKTTSALNIGLRASQLGLRVLLIDLDQQGNLSFALGVNDPAVPIWVDVIENKTKIAQTILPVCAGLDVIPSHLNNSVLEKILIKSYRNWVTAVATPLKEISSSYDLIVIDTAPNLSMVNTAVTYASNLIILPVTPEPFALLGLQKHLAELREIEKEFGLTKLVMKILFTRFDGREQLSQKYLDYLAENYEDMLLDSYIRVNTDIKRVQETGKNIFQTKCPAAEDYDLVTRELLKWWEEVAHAQRESPKEK